MSKKVYAKRFTSVKVYYLITCVAPRIPVKKSHMAQKKKKDPAAVKLGGKGGAATAAKLKTKHERTELGKRLAQARWVKARKKP
jgi:hypothetical protein